VRKPLRTVIEAQTVSHVVYMESSIYRRMEEAFEALKWWLARVPESGEIVDDYYWLYKQRGNRELKIPTLVVLYTFDEDQVILFSLLVRLPTMD
jgi:hypothetical protein